MEYTWELTIETVPPWTTRTPPPQVAVFPLMVHDDKVTVPPWESTPPPPSVAELECICELMIETVPE